MDGHALPEWNGLEAMATAGSFEAGLFIIWTLFGPLELWMTSLVANETLYDEHQVSIPPYGTCFTSKKSGVAKFANRSRRCSGYQDISVILEVSRIHL